MHKTIFTHKFNLDKAKELREKVNEYQNLSLEKEDKIIKREKGKKDEILPYLAWDRICVIMDRIEDTLDYMNTMKLGNCRSYRAAFDFYEFINCAYVVIDCIKKLYIIYAGDDLKGIKNIEDSHCVFQNPNGTDCRYFEYVRSLCVVHPAETNRQPEFLNGALFHCCPFVVWATSGVGLLRSDKRDLSVQVYESKEDAPTVDIPLYMNQFYAYVDKWVNLIGVIIKNIDNYNIRKYDEWRNKKLKSQDDFENEIDYIKYLKDENTKRFGSGCEYLYDDALRIFKVNLSDKRNIEKLEKYKNAIRYSLTFLHNSLQNMSNEGFQNTGIKNSEGVELFSLLNSPAYNRNDFENCGYQLSKICYLEYDYSYEDKYYARYLLNEIKDNINKYVFFTNKESDEEVVVLVNLALYLSSLTHKSTLNRNLPNDLQYRISKLSDDEINKLNENEVPHKQVKPEDAYISFENEDGSIKRIKVIDYLKSIGGKNE